MAATSSKAVLITGANVGLGKEVARQLALTGDFDRIYLACRNADSGQSAAFDLQRLTGRPIFSVVRMDLTDVDSVRSALNTLDGPLHSVVMNAGGTGGPTPLALTADGVTHVFGSNVLGHVVLLENLLAAGGALTNAAVLVGSEAARGVRMMRMPRPTFTDHSVEEFVSVIDGSYFTQHEFNTFLAYGQVKYLGALWMSALARQHPPDLRLLTVSPGNTAGTDALRDMGSVTRALMNHVMLPPRPSRPGRRTPAGEGRQAAGRRSHRRSVAQRRVLRQQARQSRRTPPRGSVGDRRRLQGPGDTTACLRSHPPLRERVTLTSTIAPHTIGGVESR